MNKSKSLILAGSVDGISFEKALEDAIKKAPPSSIIDALRRFTLIEFHVDTGSIAGITKSYIKVRCIDVMK